VLEHDRWLCGVLSQPDIEAERGAGRTETETMMRARGFSRRAGDNYANERLLVEDLHCGNVLADRAGNLLVIDPAIYPQP
jgi:hypothetical protein